MKPHPDFPIDNIIGASMTDVIRERARAIVAFGHDADKDDELGLHAIGAKATAYMQIATDRATGTPERRNLQGAYLKAIQATALGLALADAIAREMTREGGRHG